MVYKVLHTSMDLETYQKIKSLRFKVSTLIRIGLQNVMAKETLTDLMKLEVRETINKILDIRLDQKLEEIGLKKMLEQLRPISHIEVEIMKLNNRMIDLEHSLEVIQRSLNNR
jgi:hypothetical protein